ncbi:MAG: 1-deoxy-D-xylulose-5-phosphate reductoisomerase [Candidatus Gracilibacteria bacterium]
MKHIVIFGSTGSIGRQTLEVLREFPDKFKVVGLTGLTNKELLHKQAEEFLQNSFLKPKIEAKSVPGHRFAILAPTKKQITELVKKSDYVINALPGFAGLEVSLATIKASTKAHPKTLLSANKESLAIAGKYLKEEAKKTGTKIFPLDSEASAIWQLMHDFGQENVKSVTLTCSGGPFYGKKNTDLKDVTVEQALAHPTWRMGKKVSVDSATLINKILEIYEVHNLFDIPLKDIHIVIHRQSLVHSMIHLKSSATRMHITQNDMRLFISYALNYPAQPACPWSIKRVPKSTLTFASPDDQTFRPLNWFNLHKGNPNFPIVLNALNDIAVKNFLAGKLSFLGIYDFIEEGLDRFLWEVPVKSLSELIEFHNRITKHFS